MNWKAIGKTLLLAACDAVPELSFDTVESARLQVNENAEFNAKSFTLTLENWAEHSHNAWKEDHRSPLIVVNFNDRNKVAIIEWEQFMFLKTFYEENNNE